MKRSNSARYSMRPAGREKSILRILKRLLERSSVTRIVRLIDLQLLQCGRAQMFGDSWSGEPNRPRCKRFGERGVQLGQCPGVAEQRLQAFDFCGFAARAELKLAAHEIDRIGRDPRLKGGMRIA